MKSSSNCFIPKHVLIHPKAKDSDRTKEIVRRIHTFAPQVQITHLPDTGFSYPSGLTGTQKHWFMKESVIITERTVPFIRTFASPGAIVEDLTTVCNLTHMCCSNCEFCYLQIAQCLEHYIYTNRHDLEAELATSSFAHAAILTVWSMYSFGIKAPLLKLPKHLMEIGDEIRKQFVRRNIATEAKAIDYLCDNQQLIFEKLKGELPPSEFGVPQVAFNLPRDIIERLYLENRKHPLTLTISEFADIFAIDHLTGNMSFLMQMLGKYPDLRLVARTKSAYVDEMIRYDGLGRMHVQMGLNTEHVISSYEHGTSTLDERIEAAMKIQQAKGIDLTLAIEPMIIYEGWEEDYAKMIDQVMAKLDPMKLDSIIVGSVRYRPQLRDAIQKHFPATSLIDSSQCLQEPVGSDKRLRYSLDLRVKMYSMVRDRFALYTNAPIKLGAENPEVWESLE